MPLIHSKKPKAFRENIRTEMHAGKPQKQAVAIAYDIKRKAEHKADGGCIGPSCKGCSSANCYADGGRIKEEPAYKSGYGARDQDAQSGVHGQTAGMGAGTSTAGRLVRKDMPERAKALHRENLKELKSMPKPNLYADGGQVSKDDVPEPDPVKAAQMQAGASSGDVSLSDAYNNAKKAFGFKDGGEVHEDAEQDHEMIDSELHDMLGEELMSAIDAKDKKRIMESLETIVLQCMNKE